MLGLTFKKTGQLDLIIHLRPVSGEKDAWKWENTPFSVHKAYKRFRERHGTEDETTIRACLVIWKQKVPL